MSSHPYKSNTKPVKNAPSAAESVAKEVHKARENAYSKSINLDV